ncbi:hypothetical protein [Streptomyces sp. NPDC047014]|uniref:hypothetical protein n=1 Tax=Streptomyces sp. NPDC047014 TaxID=3155736 RepID=UPI0033CBAEC6
MALLLDVLGLPTDTLTALLPLLPETGDAPMTNTPAAPTLSAHEAMAISMHNNGYSEEAIREATGLTETELSDLIADRVLGLPRPAATSPVIDVPVIALPLTNAVQKLLDWAAAHPAAGVRSRAARITADLAELSERRDSEAAQREAEEKVAKARAELEKAQEDLRSVKASTRTTTVAAAPTPIRAAAGSGHTREELAAIRTWARANDHQIADQGMGPSGSWRRTTPRTRRRSGRQADRGRRRDSPGRLPRRGDRARRPARVDGAVPPHHLPDGRAHGRDDPALQRRDPAMARTVIHDLVPGDKLRVTGYLRLPRTPDEPMWLVVSALTVLETAPQRSDPAALSTAVIERYGPYVCWFDAEDSGEIPVWTEAGVWVGTAGDPDALSELIAVFEQRQAAGGE